MTKKILLTAGIAFSVLILLVSSASAAISFFQTDGVWGRVDDGYDGIVFDVVGVIGSNPGTAWTGTGGQTTAGALIRIPAVCTHDNDGDANLNEWSYSAPGNPGNLGSHTFIPTCNYQGLFISEYRQGTVDAIELFNNMGEPVDLAAKKFSIQIYNNGSSTPSVNIPLSGTIANHSTFVIASAAITGITTNQVSPSLAFDGNDAVALVRDYIADVGGDSDDGASGLIYATGPAGDDPTTGSPTTGANPSYQSPPTTDFNQIRYGMWIPFAQQSGLAFKGVNNAGVTYQDQAPFLVGKFCHVNQPIYASNALEKTYLTLDLMNMSCGTGAVAPFPPPRLTFVYPVLFDETPNSGTCPYPSDPGNPCSDAVTFTPTEATFTCFYEGDVKNVYYVQLLGFMPAGKNESCSTKTYDQSLAKGMFISQEGATNCGCLFAAVTKSTPTAVKLISFTAADSAEGVLIQWQTASETDNLGFNLYRAETETGDRVLLNSSLIPTNMPPGSPIGASYEYLDATAAAGSTYYYWLEDVDLAGVATLHGPVSLQR